VSREVLCCQRTTTPFSRTPTAKIASLGLFRGRSQVNAPFKQVPRSANLPGISCSLGVRGAPAPYELEYRNRPRSG